MYYINYISKNITYLFKLKKKPIKYGIINDIRKLCEIENEDYYKPTRVDSFYCNTISNMKVIVIEIRIYQLKNILVKLNHI